MKLLELNASGLLGKLNDTVYNKGVYRTGTLASFADELADAAGIACTYPDSFQQTTVTAYFASIPYATAFQKLAQASGCLLTESRNGGVAFIEPSPEPILTIGKQDYRSDNGFQPSDDTIINTVTVEALTPSLEAGAELLNMPVAGTLVSSVFCADNAVITTAAGVYNVAYDASANQAASISAGKLMITGQKIKTAKSLITVTNRQPTDQPCIYDAVKGNLFGQALNASALADKLLVRRAAKRRIVSIAYRGYPYLKPGDTVSLEKSAAPFFVTRNKLSLGGGMTGILEVREL
jgi:hypothetical protein